MALVADKPTSQPGRRSGDLRWHHFEADTRADANRVATGTIRDFYINNSRRIARSFAQSNYLSQAISDFIAIKSRFDVLMACVVAAEGICSDVPNAEAIARARLFLDDLISVKLFPSKTVPVPSGGVAFYFFAKETSAYAEFLNSGGSYIVSYGNNRPTEVHEFTPLESSQNKEALHFLQECIGR